jgi:acyl carrier protein phosphodiesterase
MIISMTSRDWLTNYANLEGLKWSLKGISSRLKYESDIENATEILTAQYQEFEDDFFQFFQKYKHIVKNS